MKISRATKAYDTNALNKPWIAPVTLNSFNQYEAPDFDNPIKGAFIGNEGEAGELVIEIKAGSAVAFGQASKREGIRGTTSFGIVQNDGTLQEVDRKALVEPPGGPPCCRAHHSNREMPPFGCCQHSDQERPFATGRLLRRWSA